MKFDIYRDFERYLFTRELSEGTVDTYVRVARLMENYLYASYGVRYSTGLRDIRGYMVSNWASSIMGHKVSTRALYINAANVFLRFLHSMQYVDFKLQDALPPTPNVARYNRLHPDEYQPKTGYTAEEVSDMLSACSADNFSSLRSRAIIATLTTTGLRVSELASLNIRDLYEPGDGFVLVARKGSHGCKQKVPFPEAVLPYIMDYLARRRDKGISCEMDDPLFVSRRGRRMDRNEIRKGLGTVQKKTGCDSGCHRFRHTALTHIAKNADPVISRDVAGQKSVSITNRYLHSTDEEMKNAVADLAKQFL